MPRRKPPSRLALAWLALVTLVMLSGCSQEVLHNVAEDEAARIVSVLQQHGITATKALDSAEDNSWRIVVPRSSVGRAFAILAEYKLPRVQERRFQDVFGKRKLVMTPSEERALFLEALQGEISHTLESIDGVIDARVHLVSVHRDITGKVISNSKASVMLEYQPNERGLTPLQPNEVKKLVANAVENLSVDGVEVIQKPASIAAPSIVQPTDFNLVSVGPLVVEESALPALKFIVGIGVLLLGGLGVLVFHQSRQIANLRDELTFARTGVIRQEDLSGESYGAEAV